MNPWSLTVMPAMDRLAEVLIWRRRELGGSIFTYEALFDMAQQIFGRAFGPNWLSIIKSVLFITFSFTSQVQEQSNYRPHAEAALTTLQQWYNQSSGLWDTTGWWNSANCLIVPLTSQRSIRMLRPSEVESFPTLSGKRRNTTSSCRR